MLGLSSKIMIGTSRKNVKTQLNIQNLFTKRKIYHVLSICRTFFYLTSLVKTFRKIITLPKYCELINKLHFSSGNRISLLIYSFYSQICILIRNEHNSRVLLQKRNNSYEIGEFNRNIFFKKLFAVSNHRRHRLNTLIHPKNC